MPHVGKKKKKVFHSEYSGCFRGLTNDPAIIKMQTYAFGLLIHHTVLLHTATATVARWLQQKEQRKSRDRMGRLSFSGQGRF